MDTVKGLCSHGKEKLLGEDYISLPLHKTPTRTSRLVEILYVGILITTVTAGIVSCVCAVYCHVTLAEIRNIQRLNDISHKTPAEATTELPKIEKSEYDIDSEDFEYEDLVDIDEESEVEESSDSELNDDEVYPDGTEDVDGSGSEEDEYDLVRKRRDDTNKGRKKKKCSKSGKNGKKCRKEKKIKKLINLPAAHFEVKFSDKDVKEYVRVEHNAYKLAETCKEVEELEGKLCLNRTYYPDKSGVPLNIFKPSTWVDEKTSPVKFGNSVAQAKAAGIYLIYAQGYIGGQEPEKSIVVVQTRGDKEINAISCRTGVHPDHYDSLSGQLQTCSVLGLMHLEKGDTISIQKSSASAKIILDIDKTYFGLVQLSGVELPKSRKRIN